MLPSVRKKIRLPERFSALERATSSSAEEESRAIVGDLLRNVYRAFDYRDETAIYDTLVRMAHRRVVVLLHIVVDRAIAESW